MPTTRLFCLLDEDATDLTLVHHLWPHRPSEVPDRARSLGVLSHEITDSSPYSVLLVECGLIDSARHATESLWGTG